MAVRKILDSDFGVRRCLNADFENKRANGGLWGGAKEFLLNVVDAHLVGVTSNLDEILAKARKWIDAAMNKKEACSNYSPSFLGEEHRITWSLCNWLQGQPDNLEMARQAADFANQYFTEQPDSVADTFSLGLGSLTFIEGQRYAEYLHWADANGKIPLGVAQSKIRGEASVCAAICQAKTTGHYNDADIAKIVQRLLDMRMNEWLTTGNEIRAARWLKLAYWQEGQAGLSPREVMLKAYDHLPTSPKPPFLEGREV